MANKKKKREKYSGLKGYRLHLARFKFSSKQGIRTIKFPLGQWDAESEQVLLGEKEQEFCEKIKRDYENLYGPLNLPTYRNIQEKNQKEIYSLKDFWVDSLRAGVILMHTNAKLLHLVKSIDGTAEKVDSQVRKSMQKKDKVFYESIDFEKFKKEVLLPRFFKPDKKAVKIFNDSESAYAKKKTKEILSAVKGRGQGVYRDYWKNAYGADISLYSPKKMPGDGDFAEGTFYILPDFEFSKTMDVQDCLERIEDFIKNVLSSKRGVEELIGISNKAGGFSNYFNKVLQLLRDGEIDMLEKYIVGLTGMWDGKVGDLRKRLAFLSSRAKRLGRSELVNGWHEYRSDIGGGIQSWISNALRRDEEIKKQLFGSEERGQDKKKEGHIDELRKIDEWIDTQEQLVQSEKGRKDFEQSKEEIKDLVSQLKNQLIYFGRYEDAGRVPIAELQVYRDLLATFRVKFNFFFQEVCGYIEDEEVGGKNKKSGVKGAYPVLFEELKTPPSFIGDVKMAQSGVYDKYLSSLDRLRVGIDFLCTVGADGRKEIPGREKEKDVERIRHSLQSIVRMYQSTQSAVGKHICEKALRMFGFDPDDFIEHKKEKKGKGADKNFNHIWRNKNAREKRGKNVGDEVKDADYLKQRDNLLTAIKPSWDKYETLDISIWLDLVALEKIRIGLLAYFYDISATTFPKNKDFVKHYPNVSVIEKRFKQKDSDAVNTIVQTGFLSEMKGTLSKMSVGKLMARYVVQPMNSEDGFPIVLMPQGEKDERYFVSPKTKGEIRKDGKKKEPNAQMLKNRCKVANPDNIESVFVEKEGLFEVQSSRAQMQFLHKSFSGFWKEYTPTLLTHSFIFEEFFDVKWSDAGCVIQPTKDANGGDKKKMFVSIPFKIGYETSKERNDALDRRNALLGVDIGEYGVATYLLDAEHMGKSTHRSFVYEPSLRKIKEGIQENKEKQKAGTFSVPNTKVKRLRDNATTILRNRIHDLVVRNNARPVYEKEVSAFESGSGKVSKIYHSLKRSDVYHESPTEEAVGDLVWGSKSKLIGKDVSAYGTSYMCSKCHKSIYTLIGREEYGKQYKIKDVDSKKVQKSDGKSKYQHIVEFDIDGERVKGYIESDKQKEVGDVVDGKTAQKAVKEYARPPMKIFLDRHGGKKVLDALGIDSRQFEDVRGSQAIYVCPFCGHIADADIQAAMWVALKGWLQLHLPSTDKNKSEKVIFKNKEIQQKWGKESDLKKKLKYLMEYAKKKKIPAIGLENLNVKQKR